MYVLLSIVRNWQSVVAVPADGPVSTATLLVAAARGSQMHFCRLPRIHCSLQLSHKMARLPESSV